MKFSQVIEKAIERISAIAETYKMIPILVSAYIVEEKRREYYQKRYPELILIDITNSYNYFIKNITENELKQLFKTLKPELCNKKEQESLARFLIPICLIDDFMVDTEIVRFAYIQVNRLLATQSFPEYEWEKLEELLPEVAWYNNWDRCKRLRKGLKKKGYQIKELKEKEELPKYLL